MADERFIELELADYVLLPPFDPITLPNESAAFPRPLRSFDTRVNDVCPVDMRRREEQQMGFGTVQPQALPQYLTELKDRGVLCSDELFLDIGTLSDLFLI
jgi:hypothetical protein